MKIGICEDEQLYLEFETEKVKEFFAKKGEKAEIEQFTDGNQILEKVTGGVRYDLILLDIQMKYSDGMEIAAEIRKYAQDVPIIFVTGIESRAVEGYHVDALDYVVKSDLNSGLEAALIRFADKRKESTLVLETVEGDTIFLPFGDIMWVESEKRGIRIITGKKEYFSSHPIGKVSGALPENQFVEIYKSVFVQIRAIKRIGSDFVEMENEEKLPMSRRKRKQVMSKVLELAKGRM